MLTAQVIKENGKHLTKEELAKRLNCEDVFYALDSGNHLYCVQIKQDRCPENPRTTFDHIGTMLSVENDWVIGDEDGGDEIFSDIDLARERVEYLKAHPDEYLILPVYMYEHSGQTISLTPFNDPWDSGCCGYIYGTKASALKELAADETNWKEKLTKALEGEVKEYDQYITGNIYGCVVNAVQEVRHTVVDTGETWSTSENNFIESCYGFFGEDHEESGLLDFARENLPDDVEYYYYK